MNLAPPDFLDLAAQIVSGEPVDEDVYKALSQTEEKDVFSMMAGANIIRDAFFKNKVHFCTICNGKSGRCSEDCTFCSQSKYVDTDINIYPLLSKADLQKGAIDSVNSPINRYSIVTSGKGLPKNEIEKIAEAFSELEYKNLSFCVSLGILDEEDFKMLKGAGVGRYHHNLETARSHFDRICTTHTFQDRVDTINAAKKAGMSICAGGIFGTGETMEQVLELALELKGLDVDAVPINFLSPIKGTPLENCNYLTPLKCLKIIALFRYVLPRQDLLICGGRVQNIKMLHPMIFNAGASGLMTGRYLTTDGNQLEDDMEMIRQLGFEIRT